MGLKEGISSRIAALTLGLDFIGEERKFYRFAPILEATEKDIVWTNTIGLCYATDANIIVCSQATKNDNTFIISKNPRLDYTKLVNLYADNIFITGDFEVGANPKIHENVVIYDNVKIGDNCIIHPGCVIGSEGFGFVKDDDKLVKFPHIGKVIIGDNVEIQAMTNIDRGTLGNTIIGDGTKIDTHCHIGHNTRIGKNCTICAKTQTGGSNIIEDNVFLAPNTVIRTGGITIGKGAFTGAGSLIVKDVKSGDRVMGHPAKPF